MTTSEAKAEASVEVPISEQTGTEIAVRIQTFQAAERDLNSYMNGIMDGLAKPRESYRGLKAGPNGVPVALLFEEAADETSPED